jgi:hypothetical protein
VVALRATSPPSSAATEPPVAFGVENQTRRSQTEAGNATYLRPYDDERIIINLSVWETVEDLRNFVYGGNHAEVLRQRRDWFENFEAPVVALWWVPAGHIPSIDEAKKRLAHLQERGPMPFAFSF